MPIRRGEIYWINWDPARGSEQAGRRPGLIVSNDIANEHAPIVVVATMTTRRPSRPYPFVVEVSAAQTGLSRDGTINCLQLLTVDKGRLLPPMGGQALRPAGRVPGSQMVDVDRALKAALALD
ncbi:MAG: type II toxin-antitoxin system PemK/MazF family toxin [Chloroflexi bacterium]|nr:type II toxin-antitoxin system PemK/MazF family toxin [Chloroflexota bacterium]